MLSIQRSLKPQIINDLNQKIVLISGPRQVGKTFLSRELFPDNQEYLNFDSIEGRKIIRDQSWSRNRDLITFDEIHKMRDWKRWLKGIYDVEGVRPRLLATGSARMDIFRRGGESLAGRHHLLRLHPFSVAEVKAQIAPSEALHRLIRFGGFPEPFLAAQVAAANRWRKSHLERILREDLIDLERVRELKQLEILVDLLSERVGGTISYTSLAKDLEVSPHTVKKWIQILENLFIVFKVLPYSKNISRSILKEPKIYFFDTGRVVGDDGAKFENVVACSLLKRQHFLEDVYGESAGLFYLKNKEKKEVDFFTVRNRKAELLIEVKLSDDQPSSNLTYFSSIVSPQQTLQLVHRLKRESDWNGIEIRDAATWLAQLET